MPNRTGRLVVGLGAAYRGDDAVGPTVVAAVRAAMGDRDDVELVEQEDPTLLIESWAERELVVVVDAVRSGAPAGTLHLVSTGPGRPPIGDGHGRDGSTHEWGLSSALELARAINRLPEQVVVVGVEAAAFDWGAPLSPAVADAVPAAAAEVLRLIAN